MSELTMAGFDLFMRYTAVDGKTSVVQHRVWDKQAFLAARAAEAASENGKQKGDAPRMASAQQITHEQYLRERA